MKDSLKIYIDLAVEKSIKTFSVGDFKGEKLSNNMGDFFLDTLYIHFCIHIL
jgi:hypothetical protein